MPVLLNKIQVTLSEFTIQYRTIALDASSGAIGQLKWIWFSGKKPKEIIDFEIFDKVSRGAWESFLLLFRTKGKTHAGLEAILTLLLLATDTFRKSLISLSDGSLKGTVRYHV